MASSYFSLRINFLVFSFLISLALCMYCKKKKRSKNLGAMCNPLNLLNEICPMLA